MLELGHPENDLQCVHIAGTNGKGSNSFMMAALLQQAGYRVGRFISPHIHLYCERFVVDDCEISPELLLSYLDLLEDRINRMQARGLAQPTEFEILTALALQFFKDMQVEMAVLEVGMGGRYDSTNVVIPRVSIITGIAYDHTAFLGSTLEEIAANKAGIIKYKVPVIIGHMDNAARQVIETEARRQQAPVYDSSLVQIIAQDRSGINGRLLNLKLPGLILKDVFFPLLGEYQLNNLATVLTALIALGNEIFPLNEAVIRKGLASIKIPGRMEIIQQQPLVVLDAAHNPQAAGALAESLAKLFPGQTRVMLCGVLDDKDAQNILDYLVADTRIFLVTKPAGPRAQEWQRLKMLLEQTNPDKPVYLEENINKAVALGLEMTGEDEYFLITGSFYVLDQARRYLTRG